MKRTTDRPSIRQSHARLPRLRPTARRVPLLNRCTFCGTEVCQCRQRIGVTATGARLASDLHTVRDMNDEADLTPLRKILPIVGPCCQCRQEALLHDHNGQRLCISCLGFLTFAVIHGLAEGAL